MTAMEAELEGRRNGSCVDLQASQDDSKTSILVRMNDRLQRALDEAELDIDDVARALRVNHRTVERWLAGRVPYPRYRRAVAKLVNTDAAELWPGASRQSAGTSTTEIVHVYSERAYVPAGLWRRLLERGQGEINLLGSALLYLFEDSGFVELLRSAPCDVRIALADPNSATAVQRDAELNLGSSLAGRIEASIRNLKYLNLKQLEGHTFEVRLHSAPMYCSLFRVDDEMLVTPHVYGRAGRLATPILHLRRREPYGIFESYLQHFEDVFYKAAVPLRPAAERAKEAKSRARKPA